MTSTSKTQMLLREIRVTSLLKLNKPLYGAISCLFSCFFLHSKTSPHLLQKFRRMLRHVLTSHQHEGEQIMTEFLCLGELIL